MDPVRLRLKLKIIGNWRCDSANQLDRTNRSCFPRPDDYLPHVIILRRNYGKKEKFTAMVLAAQMTKASGEPWGREGGEGTSPVIR